MNKMEFLDQLRQSLNGKVDAGMISDNLRYYEEYIDGQLMQGKAETEVMATLGSPRLIARTILDANRVDGREEVYQDQAQDPSWSTRSQGYQADDGYQAHQGKVPWILKFFTLPRWLRSLISFVILILILVIFFSVLKFLAPVIALALITVFLVKLFRDWLQ